MEITIIDKQMTQKRESFVVELELNNKVIELSIQEDYDTNSDNYMVCWEFLDDDLDDENQLTDEETEFIDDWVKSYKYNECD